MAFDFDTLSANDLAGYSTINGLITSINNVLDTSPRLLTQAAVDAAGEGKAIIWSSGTTISSLIDTASIAASAVTESKIADDAVTQAKIAPGAVGTTELATTLNLTSKTVTVSTETYPNDTNAVASTAYVQDAVDAVTGGAVASAPLLRATTNSGNVYLTATTNALTATGTLTASIAGNVAGNVVGNVTGNVSGNVSGSAASATSATSAMDATYLRGGNSLVQNNANSGTGTLNTNITGNAGYATSAGYASSTASGQAINITGSAGSAGNTNGGYINGGTFASSNTSINKVTSNPANLRIQTGSPYEFERSTSSRRYKTNIRQYTPNMQDLLNFRGVLFNSICDGDDKSIDRAGFIAEEAEECGLGLFVEYDDDNVVQGFNYQHFTAALLELCKYQQDIIDNLETRVTALEA